MVLNLILIILLIISLPRPPAPAVIEIAQALTPTETIAAPTAAAPTAATATPIPTQTPTAAAFIPPTLTPRPSATPSPTQELPPTAPPTAPPTPIPSPTIAANSGPDWLKYLNLFRIEANLPPLTENPGLTYGSELHSMYMVKTDQIAHSQDMGQPWFSLEGMVAAENGNLAATEWFEAPYQWAIDYWFTAPFHGLPIIDPNLTAVGFGLYRERIGRVTMGATMDVRQGRVANPPEVVYPVQFPRDGGQTWVLSHALFEYPDPLASCPGYARPTGAPVMLLLGAGDRVPSVTRSRFIQLSDGVSLAHCIFDQTNYVNPNPSAQQTGRLILAQQNAIILIPFQRHRVGHSYEATIETNGETYTWQFTAVARPALP